MPLMTKTQKIIKYIVAEEQEAADVKIYYSHLFHQFHEKGNRGEKFV
jgi:hypothetical protein